MTPKNKDKEHGGALRFDEGKPDYTHIHPLVWQALLIDLDPLSEAYIYIKLMDDCMNKWFYNKESITLNSGHLAIFINKATPVLEFGAQKYAPMNYTLGMKFSRVMKSYRRHVMALLEGEEFDKESKLPHGTHAICNLLFALTYDQLEYGCGPLDDRVLLGDKDDV